MKYGKNLLRPLAAAKEAIESPSMEKSETKTDKEPMGGFKPGKFKFRKNLLKP